MPLLIAGPRSSPAPSEYTLSPGAAFQPESVTATFDGSGAASSFLACLSIYAQSGELLSRTFPSDAIAAGGSAEVTFAPFLRPTGGGGGGEAAVVWGYGDSRIPDGFGGWTVNANLALLAGVRNKLAVHFAAGSDGYGSTFQVGLDQDGVCGWQITREGIYRVMIGAETYNDVEANGPGRTLLLFDWTDAIGNGGQDNAFNRIPRPRNTGADNADRYSDEPWVESWLPLKSGWTYPVTLRIFLYCDQNSTLNNWFLTAHRLGDYDDTHFANIFSTGGMPQC